MMISRAAQVSSNAGEIGGARDEPSVSWKRHMTERERPSLLQDTKDTAANHRSRSSVVTVVVEPGNVSDTERCTQWWLSVWRDANVRVLATKRHFLSSLRFYLPLK
ncbi:hypothetical protein BaRGS_00022651 [Batillaria attramentaria]|uniref:Uncharacterized protein n=1 Tax=Batillaria attramentaria TaxID=370345 RepID=A0ABD0KFZ8_9CAEN